MRKKTTFYIDAQLWEEVKRRVAAGHAKSQREFVEEALRVRLRQIERREWVEDMIAASKDPLFLADQEEVMKDFEYADAEAARMIDELEERRSMEEPL